MSAIIGYWGQGQRDELAGQFNKILSTIHPLPKHYQHSFAEQGTQMGVAWWGDNVRTKTDDQKIEVALSASGLKTETDVTIKAGMEGLEFSCDSFGRVPFYWLQQQNVIWFSNRVQPRDRRLGGGHGHRISRGKPAFLGPDAARRMGAGAGALSVVHAVAAPGHASEVCPIHQAGRAGMRLGPGVGPGSPSAAGRSRTQGSAAGHPRRRSKPAEAAPPEVT